MEKVQRFYDYSKDIIVHSRVNTCCCFVPLRTGIFMLAYFDLVTSLVLIVGTPSGSFPSMAARVQAEVYDDDPTVETCILPPIVDLAFTVVLICAMHRSDLVLLHVYCWYGVLSIATCTLAYSIVLGVIPPLYLFAIVVGLVYKAYIVILVRSWKISIRLTNAAAKNEFYYDRNKAAVTLRDVEKGVEEKREEIREELHKDIKESEPSVSKSSTLKVDAETSTRLDTGSWRTTFLTVNRPVTKVDVLETPSEATTSKDVTKLGTKDETATEPSKTVIDTLKEGKGSKSSTLKDDKTKKDSKDEALNEEGKGSKSSTLKDDKAKKDSKDEALNEEGKGSKSSTLKDDKAKKDSKDDATKEEGKGSKSSTLKDDKTKKDSKSTKSNTLKDDKSKKDKTTKSNTLKDDKSKKDKTTKSNTLKEDKSKEDKTTKKDSKNAEEDKAKDEETAEQVVVSETEVKEIDEAPPKKRRGLFRKTPKDKKKNDS